MVDEVEVVVDGVGVDMGDDGMGYGKGLGWMLFGVWLVWCEMVGWCDCVKLVLNVILLVFD